MLGMETRATLQKYMNKRRDSSKRLVEREGIKELKTWHQQSKKHALVVQQKNVFIPVKTRYLLR
jgi:hypothetical protein